MKMPPMPESDKVIAAAPQSQKLGEFLDWLGSKGIILGKHVAVLDPPTRYTVVECPTCSDCWRVHDECSISISGLTRGHYSQEDAQDAATELEDERKLEAEDNPVFTPLYNSTERLLAEYFEIDLDKVDQEKRALLEAMREQG